MSELALTPKEINLMKFIGTKEVAALMGCSIPVARQIMRRKDFPLIKCGKNLNEGSCNCDTFVPDPRMTRILDIYNANKEEV